MVQTKYQKALPGSCLRRGLAPITIAPTVLVQAKIQGRHSWREIASLPALGHCITNSQSRQKTTEVSRKSLRWTLTFAAMVEALSSALPAAGAVATGAAAAIAVVVAVAIAAVVVY